MPAAMEYAPEDASLREAANKELKARREDCAHAWKYYRGDHRRHLRQDRDGTDDNVVINLWKQAIDREVTFLFPAMVGLELDESQDTEAERWLRLAWEANKGTRLLRQLGKFGAVCGHVFAKLMLDERSAYPRVVALDPANVLCWWRADDYERVLWYEIRWSVGTTEYRQDIVDMGDGGWKLIQYAQVRGVGGQAGKWEAVAEESWAYPLGPIVDWPHVAMPGNYYGSNESALLRLNDKVNKVASDISRILRFHASPKTVGTGFDAEKVTETAVENFWVVNNENAKIYNLEMASDLVSSMNYLEALTAGFMAEKRSVILKGAAADFQRVTNMGVRTIFMDALAKVAELRLQYEPGVVAISQRLRMLGGFYDFDAPIVTAWPDPLPHDPNETVSVLEREMGMGIVSKETAARERGRNWKVEQERIAEEDSANDNAVMRQLQSEMGAGDAATTTA